MKEQLISYETAVLAKEKGFDWESEKFYIPETGKICNMDAFIDIAKNLTYTVSAPTQSLLQKWLRDEKNIHISVDHFWDWDDFSNLVYRNKEEKMHQIFSKRDGDYISYETYEEALEAGLQEALKLIES